MSGVVNAARGEVALEIDGQRQVLCLTLGALAKIEAALGCTKLSELDVRMRALSAADLRVVLAALLQDRAVETVLADVSPGAAAKAVAEAFRLGLAA